MRRSFRGVRGAVLAGAAGLCVRAAWGQTTGPDVIVGDISDVLYTGTVNGVLSYAVGTVVCNAGDTGAVWLASTPQHPVIAQNLYRLRNGRFEQLGQSWVKHTYGTVNDSYCWACAGGSGTMLGPGCSDPYNAPMNSGQMRLGPRSDVNVTAGAFPYPYTIAFQATGDPVYKRCQVAATDVQAGSLYFAEAQYVTADDAQAGNGLNNASYRRITIGPPGFAATVQEETLRETPAIFAWRDQGLGPGTPDPGVTLVPADYTEQGLTARFWVGAKATDNGNGTWHYEYAVQNLNSHRSAGSFAVPLAGGVAISGLGWHGVPCHSGEVFSNAPWTAGAGGRVVFAAPESYAVNPNTNALRWGTLYTFRFDASTPPAMGRITLGLFRPGAAGEPSEVSVALPAPATGPCYANCDNSSSPPALNVADFTCYLQRFAAGDPYANCDASTLPPSLNVADFTCFLQRFAAGCG